MLSHHHHDHHRYQCLLILCSGPVLLKGLMARGFETTTPPSSAQYQGDDNNTNDDSDSTNNETIGTNNLGNVANACASGFCSQEVDALDLWISLQEVCMTNQHAQPYTIDVSPHAWRGSSLNAQLGTSPDTTHGLWSPVTAGALCGILWVVGIFSGFRSGRKFRSHPANRAPF